MLVCLIIYCASVIKMYKRAVYAKYKDKSHTVVCKMNKKCKDLIKSAKKEFEQKLHEIIKLDSKSCYAYARSKSKSKVRPGILNDSQRNLVTSGNNNSSN
jgi:hypothetical protein